MNKLASCGDNIARSISPELSALPRISRRYRIFVVAICTLLATSCAIRSGLDFRVVPATPNYLLHNPDSSQTPFGDVLRVYNGFEPGRGWMDLHPQMELRIEDAYYEPGATRGGLNGFLGTEVAQYKVGPHGGPQLLSVQSMKNRPDGQPPVQNLISPSQQRKRYFRFYYEILFRKSKRSRGSVLLGANTETEVGQLAAQLTADPDSVCNESSENCTIFPQACTVSIEMEIVVNGSPRNVLWGSFLSTVVDHPQHLELSRLYRGRLTPVRLDTNDMNALLLPLLPGDRVTWR